MSFRNLVKPILPPKGTYGPVTWQKLKVVDEEFRFRLYRLWRCFPRQLGIAVSGGVDSMALAWLTKALLLTQKNERMKVHAFIVDHGARPESAEVAIKVADIMTRYNFQPHILPLSWGPEGVPKSGFETRARIARYQALARACVKNDVNHLLLGHHSDDLAETVMMRIICSSRAEGLRGMKDTARIPEAWGIYGASTIQIGRPFLNISKLRLKRTCQEDNVQWFPDPTNDDASYTQRNAIRKLLYHKPLQLPAALQKPSLVQLAYKAAQKDTATEVKAGEVIRNTCKVRVNGKTGVLSMILPETTLRDMEPEQAAVLLKVLNLLAEQITPLQKIKRRSMVNALANIYGRGVLEPMCFTAAGLSWFRGADKQWNLARVPHSSLSFARATEVFTFEKPKEWSEWRLWDGRWWMRVQSLEPNVKEVIARPVVPEDMKQLKQRLKQLHRPDVMSELQALGPKGRFTIPIITMGEEQNENKDPVLLGLPSLRVGLLRRVEELVKWEIFFKTLE